MPIYEYQCAACGHVTDALQKISDAPLTDCPACQQARLQKLVSASSFQLKGTGWYATDFKTKPQAATTTNDTPAASAPPAGETKTTTTDTKTDKGQ